jgi:hypothetical protein
MNNNNVLKGYRKKEHLIGKGMFSEGSTILEGKTNKCGRGHHRCLCDSSNTRINDHNNIP